MKYIAFKPQTKEELIKRRIALLLDDTFIFAGKNNYIFNNIWAKDWDELVDKIYNQFTKEVPEEFKNENK